MSTWLRLLNEVKSRPAESYLTPSQHVVCNGLIDRLRIPGKHINLHGPHGCGKTVLAWNISLLTDAAYISQPRDIGSLPETGSKILVMDHIVGDEIFIRRLLSEVSLRNFDALLIITNTPAALRMETVSLPMPNSQEVKVVLNHFASWGYFLNHDLPETPNFWQVMQACL